MIHSRCQVELVVFALITISAVTSQSNLVFEILEEQKADTFVGDVAKASGLEISSSHRRKFEMFGSDTPRTASLFMINSSTGMIYTSAMIDREQVCESATTKCKLEFDVAVKMEASATKILHVSVTILDINDNPPIFPTKELQLSIPEGSPKDSDYSISGAIDKDAQPDATITYWLEENEFFGLREEKLMGASLLKIVMLHELDREKQSEYRILLFAKDGNSSAALTGTMSVTITVTDINDNYPQFSRSVFNFTVLEDAQIGTFIGTVEAIDIDAGDNARLEFSYNSLTSNKFLQLFDLDMQTGNVTVKSSLEYESGKNYQAVVMARDHGTPPKASQTFLVINVLDAGNTPPKIILAGPVYQSSIVLPEDLPVPSIVGRLRYQDNDDGDNGVVDCVSLNPHFMLVFLEENSLAIEVSASLNREASSEMVVVLRCADHGSPSLSTFANFTVRISDVNDNSPIFRRVDYSGRVKENEISRQNIVQVSATDDDEGINSELTYHLTSNTSNSFSVDPFTGWISLTAAVDRETDPTFRLVVEAVDRGEPSLTGSVVVTIYVDDINDQEPRITKTDYQVRENEDPATFEAQVIATDNDVGLNSELSFLLISDSTSSFSVSSNGVIRTLKTLNREAIDLYKIVVSVTDKGTPSLTTTSTLYITITDANDHTPQFLYPKPGNDSLVLSANLSPGTVFATANAIDLDINKNAQLIYLIAEGNPRQIFAIDNSTGAIYLARRLTTRSETNYKLTISVQDGGNPRLHNSTFLFITVDFSNASMSDVTSDQQQKFIIIAGVIAGITLVVAITVVAIILQLRRTDPIRRSGASQKLKSLNLTNPNCPEICMASIHQVPKLKISSPIFEMKPPETKNPTQDLNSSFGCHLFGGTVPVSRRLTLSRETLEKTGSPQLTRQQEKSQPPMHEDIHSDSSADATISDSGRGSTDVDYISSGASLNSGTSPAKPTIPYIPAKGQNLANLYCSNEVERPTFNRDSHSVGDLSGAFRSSSSYVTHKDQNKADKSTGRVRFSFDDHSINDPRLGKHPPQRQHHLPSLKHHTNNNNNIRSPCYDRPTDVGLKIPQENGQLLTPHNYLTPAQPRSLASLASPNSISQFPNPVSNFLLTKDSILRHNRLQAGSKQQQPSTKHSLLLSHHNSHHRHHQLGPLVASNVSGDEEDDDMSTTTSGSYAIEGMDDTDIISASADS